MIEAKRQATAKGAILFDAALLAQAGADASFDPAWFDATRWRPLDVRGGRGSVRTIEAPFGASVLRHYRRGGMVAAALGDNYLWTGERRTRGFAEFRLLAQLSELGLNVPAPIAAQYVKRGLSYRADLITQRIDNVDTFAALLIGGRMSPLVAERIGDALATFHAAGAYHADLNAHNILVDADKVWLIDFDRGYLRAPMAAWRHENLARLLRSCRKILDSHIRDFDSSVWTPLVRAYESAFARCSDAALRSVRT